MYADSIPILSAFITLLNNVVMIRNSFPVLTLTSCGLMLPGPEDLSFFKYLMAVFISA